MTQPLDKLPLHTPATIRQLGGERSFRRRLLELGFLPGTSLKVLRIAPMGDPLDIEIRGARFSLRRSEAAVIVVETAEVGEKAA